MTGASDSKAEAVHRLIDGVWHEDDLSVADEILDPEFVDHTSGFPDAHGPESFKDFVRTVKRSFPNCRHPIDNVVVDEASVATRWRFLGTHQKEFLGIEATGREVEIEGQELYRFADGRIVEAWASPDMLGLLLQLGVESLENVEIAP